MICVLGHARVKNTQDHVGVIFVFLFSCAHPSWRERTSPTFWREILVVFVSAEKLSPQPPGVCVPAVFPPRLGGKEMYYTIDASARPRSIDALERFAGLFMAPPRSLALYACSVNRASDLPSECGGPSVGVFVLIVGFERRKNTHRTLCVVHHLTNKQTDLQIFHHSLIVLHSSRFSNFPSTAVTAAKRHRRGSSEFIDWFFSGIGWECCYCASPIPCVPKMSFCVWFVMCFCALSLWLLLPFFCLWRLQMSE